VRLNEEIKSIIQAHYFNMRNALKAGMNGHLVQKSFEELLGGVTKENSWRSTHISMAAAKELSDQSIHYAVSAKRIRRAHGYVSGRLDRHTRTMQILSGSPKPFNEWYPFFLEHDKTVLILKEEHQPNTTSRLEDMIQLPPWEMGLFEHGSKSVKIRKRKEVVWIVERLEAIDESR
jgi:hypothetical protein